MEFQWDGVNSVAGPSMTAVGSAFFTSTGGVDGNGYGETTTGNDSFQVNDYSGIDLPKILQLNFGIAKSRQFPEQLRTLLVKELLPIRITIGYLWMVKEMSRVDILASLLHIGINE